ncbi:E3 ubiquitin-protein ligase MPSR1-like [Panicum virgatum]|uniref:E3 ubiquitin-protein ligase MPSR1-like n=1 Tax=Panicum virgatum TaxID=38727 RepID=UPI0019D64FDC|nr:E3 ubiquitin-protein ligase MPSR1-like [Panicum virgatum]
MVAGWPHEHVPTSGVEATPVRFSDGGFGGVPTSAAAIAGLKKQRYGEGPPTGADDDDDMCVICMRGYKRGRRLYVMPCAYKHRFHRKCLEKWLSRSHLCPLCRHALPTDDDQAAHRNADLWLLNVN